MNDDNGSVRNPDRDKRVRDPDQFRYDRRQECLLMIALWEKSRKIDAKENLAYWRAELERIDGRAARLRVRGG